MKTIELKNGNKDVTAIVDEPNGETLSAFLYSDVSAFKGWIKLNIEDVLHGKKASFEISCNACKLEITETETVIYNLYDEDEEECVTTCFGIGTAELMQIIEDWTTALKEIKAVK